MQYLIFILLATLIVFLFTLYVFCHDDFVLFRKNIDMEKIFNLAFASLFSGLFFARLFYVVLYFKPLYLNPLAFLLFPYFPGLSLPAGILGSSLTLMLLLGGKKYPEGRIFDFFTIAFFITILMGEILLLGMISVTTKHISILSGAEIVLLFILSAIAIKLLKNHTVKEGSIGLVGIFIFSMLSVGLVFLDRGIDLFGHIKDSSVWIIDAIVAAVFFIRHDSVSSFMKGVLKK